MSTLYDCSLPEDRQDGVAAATAEQARDQLVSHVARLILETVFGFRQGEGRIAER